MTVLLWCAGILGYVAGMTAATYIVGRCVKGDGDNLEPPHLLGIVFWPAALPIWLICVSLSASFKRGGEDAKKIAASKNFVPSVPVVPEAEEH